MMRVLRPILALLVGVAALLLVYRLAVQRCWCDVRERAIEHETEKIFDLSGTSVATYGARTNLTTLAVCTEKFPSVVSQQMLYAANLRIAGRRDDAITTYKQALRYDRRPELFQQLVETEGEAGQYAEATDNAVALLLVSPSSADMLGEPYRTTALKRVLPLFQAAGGGRGNPQLFREAMQLVARSAR